MKTRDIHSGRLWRLSFLPTALAVMLMLLIGAGSAGAAWPGKDGQVVFEGYRRSIEGEGYERTGLRSFSFSSTNPAIQLTSEMGDQDPQVSPNGLLVAFARVSSAGRYAIFLMNRDGGEVRQLTTPGERESDGEPAFDSSGTYVMFVRSKPAGSHIYAVGVGNQPLRQLTSGVGYDSSPAMSPNGRQIAFVRSNFLKGAKRSDADHIFSMRPNGSRLRDLTPQVGNQIPVSGPDFSPNSRQITFASGVFTDSEVYLMGANGSHMRAITGLHHDQYGYSQPVFSPSGSSILAIAINSYSTNLARVMLGKQGPKVHRMGAYRGGSPAWGPGT